ncbi:MAG: hypothetical protein ACSHX2_01775 [Rubritalea sp.]
MLALLAHSADDNKNARFELGVIDQFVIDRGAELALNGRSIDPFGRPLDPNVKIETPKDEPAVAIKPQVQRVLIEKEITRLAKKANIVGRSMIIEGQPYFRGDTIKVKVKGKTFPLKITSITRSKVTFYDADDKNVISLDMNNLPDLPLGSNEEVDLEGNQKTHELK